MIFKVLNSALRFAVELAALVAVGYLGLQKGSLVWGGVAILVFSLLWGTFNVPGDPSRSGRAPVPVRGIVRLTLEITLFAVAFMSLGALGYVSYSRYFGILLLFHYAISWKRIVWLVEQRPTIQSPYAD